MNFAINDVDNDDYDLKFIILLKMDQMFCIDLANKL